MTNSISSSGSTRQDFDLGHVGGFGIAFEPFPRLGPRFEPRQAEGLSPPGAFGGRRPPLAPPRDAFGHIDRLLGLERHFAPLRAEISAISAGRGVGISEARRSGLAIPLRKAAQSMQILASRLARVSKYRINYVYLRLRNAQCSQASKLELQSRGKRRLSS